jgi:hypothetical protein
MTHLNRPISSGTGQPACATGTFLRVTPLPFEIEHGPQTVRAVYRTHCAIGVSYVVPLDRPSLSRDDDCVRLVRRKGDGSECARVSELLSVRGFSISQILVGRVSSAATLPEVTSNDPPRSWLCPRYSP